MQQVHVKNHDFMSKPESAHLDCNSKKISVQQMIFYSAQENAQAIHPNNI